MAHHKLKTDYLIIGSGAVGMAFADTLLTDSDAHMIIVDQYPKPGGHWNVAYPFVTLHQPSQFYGVESTEMSKGYKDQIGWNKGLNELASGAEVSAYYDNVMRHRLLPSGRVQYFPLCTYTGNGDFHGMLHDDTYEVEVSKKIVDCTFLKTTVPSTHTPNFSIDPSATFMPLNDLPNLKSAPKNYTVIGGGKTGIDACLWLLQQNVNPDKITWIKSRDAWLINRRMTQPTTDFFEETMGAQVAQMKAIAKSQSPDELFKALEDSQVFLRLDTEITPQMFHAATVSPLELNELRKINNVVRLGKVTHIEDQRVILEQGCILSSDDTVYIDCSASAISELRSKTIFQGDTITPQTIRAYQPAFSASMIAHMEAIMPNDEKKKNELCQVVPLPNKSTDWIKMTAVNMMNQFNWGQDKELRKWMKDNRLDGFTKMISDGIKEDPNRAEILKEFKKYAMPAAMNIQNLISMVED